MTLPRRARISVQSSSQGLTARAPLHLSRKTPAGGSHSATGTPPTCRENGATAARHGVAGIARVREVMP